MCGRVIIPTRWYRGKHIVVGIGRPWRRGPRVRIIAEAMMVALAEFKGIANLLDRDAHAHVGIERRFIQARAFKSAAARPVQETRVIAEMAHGTPPLEQLRARKLRP